MYTSFDQWFNTKNILNNGKLEENKELFEDCWNNVESLYKQQIEDLKEQVYDLECDKEYAEDDRDLAEEDLRNLQDWKTEVMALLKSLTISDSEGSYKVFTTEKEIKVNELIEKGERL